MPDAVDDHVDALLEEAQQPRDRDGVGQAFDRSLGEAEFEMMDRFVTATGQASLLCDLVDAETVGLVANRVVSTSSGGR